MADDPRLICLSEELREAGSGVRFELRSSAAASPNRWEASGFAVRYRGKVCAYVNRCPHTGVELDWQAGEFFASGGLYLICSTHGAIFEPDSGYCIAGPCQGASLAPLQVREQNGQVILEESSSFSSAAYPDTRRDPEHDP